jgi:hypothetical protein
MKDLSEFAREADSFGHHKSAAFLDDIVGMLQKSVKFMLPDGGRLFEAERPLSPEDSDLLKLPYECTALEYSCVEAADHDPVQEYPAPKRICVAKDISDSKKYKEGVVTVIPIWYDQTKRFWTLPVYGVAIPRKQNYPLDSLTYYDYVGSSKKPSGLGFDLFPILPEYLENKVAALGREETRRQGYLDVIDEVNALTCFLLALSCSNVKIRDGERPEAIARVNKKRALKGKLPLFSYKILEIVAPRTTAESSSEATGSNRQSPRIHLRRGHIRRLATGSRIWVNACVVGQKKQGIVVKDYRVVPPKN